MIRIASCPECEKEIAVTGELSSDDEALVRCPRCDEEFPRGGLSLRDVPELILVNAVAAEATHDATSVKDDAELEVEAPVELPAFEESGEEGDEVSPIDMPVVASTARQEFGGAISTEPRTARTNGGPSFFRQLVGIIGGGVIGLAIGYFILLWIGGPEKDFLEVGRHLPPWAVPAAFHAVGEPLPMGGDAEPGQSLADLLETTPDEDLDDVPAEPEGLPPEPELEPVEGIAAHEAKVGEVVVHDPPELSTADLEAALKRASEVRLSLVAGELSDSRAGPMKSAAYRAFAALAEALTFAQATEGREGEHEQLRAEAEQLLRDTLATERMVAQLGPLAAEWLDSPTRDSTGIITAGTVVSSHMGIRHQRGIAVELAGMRRNVVVVGASSIDVPVGSRVLVGGALVDRPRERIGGYTGSASQVVWAGLVEPLDRAAPAG